MGDTRRERFIKMRVRDIKSYLKSHGVDFKNVLTKSDLVELAVACCNGGGTTDGAKNSRNQPAVSQRGGKSEEKKNDHDDDDKSGFLSMTLLCLQLNLTTNDEWEDIVNSIYCGVSRLEAIGLTQILQTGAVKEEKTNKKDRNDKNSEKLVMNLKLENIKNKIELFHLFGLILVKGINITLVDNENKHKNVIDLLFNTSNKTSAVALKCLDPLKSREAIMVYQDISMCRNNLDSLLTQNKELLLKYSSMWTIDKRIKLIEKLHESLMSNILVKKYCNGKERDSVVDVISALQEVKLGNNGVLSDGDYTTLKYDFDCYSKAMRCSNNPNSDVYNVLAKASKAVKQSKRKFFPRNVCLVFVLFILTI